MIYCDVFYDGYDIFMICFYGYDVIDDISYSFCNIFFDTGDASKIPVGIVTRDWLDKSLINHKTHHKTHKKYHTAHHHRVHHQNQRM